MPSLGDIKRRIKSVKNTQQITRAMKMVSAAKLRRAQDEIIAARPYAEKMFEMISRLAAEMAAEAKKKEAAAEAKKKEDAAKAAAAAGFHDEETRETQELETDTSVEDGPEGEDQGAAAEGEEAEGEETGELATDTSVESGPEGEDQEAVAEGEEAEGEETGELATDTSVEDGPEGEDQEAAAEGEETEGEETQELETDTSVEPGPEDEGQKAERQGDWLDRLLGKISRSAVKVAKTAVKIAEKARGSYVGRVLGKIPGRTAKVAKKVAVKGGESYVGKKVLGMIPGVAAKASEKEHPLLTGKGGPKKGVVFITSDRGLCGSFNTVLLRTMEDFLAEHADSEPVLYLMGNRGIEYFKRRGFKVFSSRPVGTQRPEYSTAAEIARELIDLYLKKEVDEVYIVYSEFISALTQVPRARKFLPITPEAAEEAADEAAEEEAPVPSAPPGPGEEAGQPGGPGQSDKAEVKFLYEPSTGKVLADLLPKHVEVQFFSALLESSASEHGARMTAMDAASRNASEMIDGLTLKYNRLRQAAITKELMEIISGAESLKA